MEQVDVQALKTNLLKAIEQRIVDFDDLELAPKEGRVTIKPVRRNKVTKEFNHQFSTFKDPRTNIVFGIPVGVDDKTHSLKFKRIRMTGSREFNLEIEVERKEFIMLKYYPGTLGSPYRSGPAKYEIHDPEAQAKANLEKGKERRRATAIADEIVYENEKIYELMDFARVLGLNPDLESEIVIKSSVMDRAENDPVEFLKQWDNSKMRSVTAIFRRGLAVGLIKNEPGKGYEYSGQICGLTENACLSFFMERPDVLNGLDVESKRLDKFYSDGAAEKAKEAEEKIETKTKTPEVEKTEKGNEESEKDKIKSALKAMSYPEEEWENLETAEKLTDYLNAKASGDYKSGK